MYRQPGSGQYILEEQFMQYALFLTDQDQWFEYMDQFDRRCMWWMDAASCGQEILSGNQVYGKAIDLYHKLDKMKLLNAWAEEMINGSVLTIPDATINGINYRGTVDAQDIA